MLMRQAYRPLFPEFGRVSEARNRDFERVFESGTDQFSWDVNEDRAVVSADVPGFSADAFDISLEKNVLSVRGERTTEVEGEDVNYLRRERSYGSFTRNWKLPFTVDADNIEANYTNGVLTITLPKVEAEKPRQITVNGG